MGTIWQDVRYGLRSLARRPGFALVVILTLALGIGANTAIFSVVNGLFLRPLPGIQHTDRLVEIHRNVEGQIFDISYPVFTDLREQSNVLDDYAAVAFVPISLGGKGGAEVIGGMNVTGNYFDVLGAVPSAGRFFQPDESFYPAVANVAVISRSLLDRHFDGDEAVIGSTIHLNGVPVELIGVAAEGFSGHAVGLQVDLWVPVGVAIPGLRSSAELDSRESSVLESIGRLREGVTAAEAEAALTTLADRWNQEHLGAESGSYRMRVVEYSPVPGVVRGGFTIFFTILMVAMALVLTIACINVAGMLLSRGAERSREIAIRQSLGAGRVRLVRQLLTESMLLALLAAGVGTLLAHWATRLLLTLKPPVPLPGIRLELDVGVDFRVLLFSLMLSTVTGILFGLAPALQLTRRDLVPALKGAGGSGGIGRSRVRRFLTAAQMAATLILLVGAGLFVRALNSAPLLDPGFDTRQVDTVAFDLQLNGYSTGAGDAFYNDLLERARSLPGVESAALARKLPLSGRSSYGALIAAGVEPPQGQAGFDVSHNVISSDYLRTLRIPLLEGRDFDLRDTDVIIINDTLARRVWPGGRALGRRVEYAGLELEVIGVAATVKYRNLGESPISFLYMPQSRFYNSEMTLHLRTAPGSRPIPEIRRIVRELDAGIPVLTAMALDDALEVHFLPQRLAAWVTAVVGLIGLGLGAIGIYGGMAYSASQRTREIGVRLALGAVPLQVARMMMRQGMVAPLLGIGIGLAGAVGVTRFLSSLLVGVSPLDPLTFAAVLVLLGLVAALANFLPARRAARLDPMRALRDE